MIRQETKNPIKYAAILVTAAVALDLSFNFIRSMKVMRSDLDIPPHIRHNFFWIVILIIAVILYFYLNDEKGPGRKEVQISGKVTKILTNDRQDVDGIEVESNEQGERFSLKFPPHTAAAVLAILKTDDRVEALGRPDRHDSENIFRIRAIRNISTQNEVIIDQLPPPPSSQGILQYITVRKPGFVLNAHHEPTGMIYENWLIEFKPHQLKNMIDLITQSDTLKVSGIERDTLSSGFINLRKYRVIHAMAIEIDNKKYMIH